MQLFDAESKAWGPRPPLDGKVELVVPKVDRIDLAASRPRKWTQYIGSILFREWSRNVCSNFLYIGGSRGIVYCPHSIFC